MKEDTSEVLTLSEAAAYIRTSEKTLGEMARQNRIPCQKVGREWRFLKHALEDWLKGAQSSGNSSHSNHGPAFEKSSGSRQLKLFKQGGFGDTAFSNNRDEPLHRWVPWIAGFSASFVGEVLESRVSGPARKIKVLDPFAGVGTTLVEAIKRGYNVVGFEINPYAALACRTKLESSKYDLSVLQESIEEFRAFMNKAASNNSRPKSRPPAYFKTRSPFFSPQIEKQSLFVLDFIDKLSEDWIKDIFRLAFGAVMVSFSNYSYEPSLGTRSAAGKKDILYADVAATLSEKLFEIEEDASLMQSNLSRARSSPGVKVYTESFLEGARRVKDGTVDVVITSPPYLNNYHYIRNTRPQLFWLGFVDSPSELTEMEHRSFGKFWQTVRSGPRVDLEFEHGELEEYIELIRELNSERGAYGGRGWANYVAAYFNDCAKFLENTRRLIKKGGTLIIVIGNNILQGVEIKTDEIVAGMAEQRGFELVDMHLVRTKRTGSSIVNSSVRAGKTRKKTELYENAVELRAL